MAQIIGDKVKLDNGQLITPNQGGWYDARQYWGGTLSEPGQINSLSNQQGAGQQVSKEVIAQTSPGNVAYVDQKRAEQNVPPLVNDVNNPTGIPGGGGGGTGIPGGVGLNQPTIDLPGIYNKLYETSGVKALQDQLSQMERDYIEATGKTNDNPFLSEASRVGRNAKLDELFQKRTANIRGDIATKKADIETQLNLQTKQFDINSQQAQMALTQFNNLLSMGALDNASGEDIANLTRSTGISSTMIMNAIKANKQKNVQTSMVPFDDGKEQGFLIINQQTGDIINKQVIGKSAIVTAAPKTETIKFDDGNSQGFAVIDSTTGKVISKQVLSNSKPAAATKASDTEIKAYYTNALRQDAKAGLKLSQIFNLYSGYLDPNLIYQLYNANSKYGPDKGDIANLEKYGVKQPS